MAARYEKGLKVIIMPVEDQDSLRQLDLEACTGKVGVITNHYWIQPNGREIFYLYTVQVDEGKEFVLYEDELQPYRT